MHIFLCYHIQALVDAPDMVRSQMNFKRLSLTDIKIDIKRVPRKKELMEAMKAAGTLLNLILTYIILITPVFLVFVCSKFNLLF